MMSPLNPPTIPLARGNQSELAMFDQLRQQLMPAQPGHFDELRTSNGSLREPWVSFFSRLGGDGLRNLPETAETVDRVIAQNGITYNVFSDKQDQSRPWSLNPLPMLITAADWRIISQGLAQRARLLNRILKDVYNERHLLDAAYLPSALVLGNPGYLRAMHGVTPPGGIYLHVVAFDVARDPEGRWWVIGQRTQSPSGLGYVLENRLIVSRLFPQTYREMRVQHIASSYRRLLEALEAQARPLAVGTPRFALLSSGPHSETYFEHAYLARYLGIPLVEGPDLTVRNDQVYLKTIHGLQRIHGLLRRLDDDFCDPLELKAESTLGVPGLLQAIRAGNVVMANALGTGFLESPAIQGFLPSICEHLLGESLHMPSLHTWWCGEHAAWQDVSPHLNTQVIKPTFANQPSTNFEPIIASLLTKSQLDDWRVWIQRQPDIYTTQTYLPFSQVPTWRNPVIESRTAMMRFYAIVGEDGDWQVMPGGMTRVAAVDPHIVSIRGGGSTLDTWVIAEDEVDTYSMLPKRVRLERWQLKDELVSSRSAENLFWLGRYTERAECMVRLAREALVLLTTNRRDSLPALNETIGSLTAWQGLTAFDGPSMSHAGEAFGESLVNRLAQRNCGSLIDIIDAMERSMRTVRDRLPPEHVEIPARIRQIVSQSSATSAIDMIEKLDRIELPLTALVGYQSDRMTRDIGWHLLSAGRLIERLINVCHFIDQFFRSAAVYTPRGFDSLLVLFDSSITYRTRYQRQQDILALLDLIVMDQSNPRAVSHITAALQAELAHLPEANAFTTTFPLLALKEEAIGSLVQEVSRIGVQGSAISDEIGRRFFAHVAEQHFAS